MVKKNQVKNNEDEKIKDVRVVGIGTSAGGLEALQEFFKNVPIDSDIAYVVIQHLSPDYKSLMDELLARFTKLPIYVIKSGMVIKPNTIYLIPPRKNLYISYNKLILTDVDLNKGLNLPIDTFFRSLAEERGKDAIGIVLSGTGSDGTAGIKAIKEKNGMVIVQDEKTAKFTGMPNSAIATGLVDFILPPSEMPETIIKYVQHPLIKSSKQKSDTASEQEDLLQKAIEILHDKFNVDFNAYKQNTILRRIERRVSINHFIDLSSYITFLEESDVEKDVLFRELLIGVTQFFRDKEAFHSLTEKVLIPLVKSDSKSIRIWSAGCSTGEEVYSVAISIKELFIKYNVRKEIKIFATDIDKKALEIAGNGIYPESILLDIEPTVVNRYFTKKENFYKINDEIRNMIVFAYHNILKDPPFSKIDLLICRNLFIYLKPEVQNKLLVMFYYALQPGGYLFMGISETIGDLTKAFKVIDAKNKIYEYISGFRPPILSSYNISDSKNLLVDNKYKLKHKFELKIDEFYSTLLTKFAPPSVIIDSDYKIISVINDINPFTEIQPGNYSEELFNILPKDLGLFINNILRELKKNKKEIVSRNLTGLKFNKLGNILVTGRKVDFMGNVYFILSFEYSKTDIENKKELIPQFDLSLEKDRKIFELEKELKSSRENLNAVIEELESSNEELQSSNEELVASNEELQSVNEELQSVNEELFTVNTELQQKIDELTRLNDDINNLLKNTQVAALYLDSKLLIRKVTPELSKITNILETDIGRPISHITLIEGYETFINDVEIVQESLQPIDKEIVTKSGYTYFIKIRPYRTEYGAIDGVIITFTEISAIKKLQNEILYYSDKLKEVLNIGKIAWFEYCYNDNTFNYDKSVEYLLNLKTNQLPQNVEEFNKFLNEKDFKLFKSELNKLLNQKYKSSEFDITFTVNNLEKRLHIKLKLTSGCIKNSPISLLVTIVDISELEDVKNKLIIQNETINIAIENTMVGIVVVDKDGNINFVNNFAEKEFGISKKEIINRTYDDTNWEILDLDKKPIKSENLPFAIVKKTKKIIKDYRHFIKNPIKGYVLINIDGMPLLKNNKFLGAIFVINEVLE